MEIRLYTGTWGNTPSPFTTSFQGDLRSYQRTNLDKILDVVDIWTDLLVPKSTFLKIRILKV